MVNIPEEVSKGFREHFSDSERENIESEIEHHLWLLDLAEYELENGRVPQAAIIGCEALKAYLYDLCGNLCSYSRSFYIPQGKEVGELDFLELFEVVKQLVSIPFTIWWRLYLGYVDWFEGIDKNGFKIPEEDAVSDFLIMVRNLIDDHPSDFDPNSFDDSEDNDDYED
jgi:hypothetical protein